MIRPTLTRALRAGALVAASLPLVALAVACSTPPKPRSLVEFEALRTDTYTEKMRKLEEVDGLMKHSDDFYALALEAYDDEEMERVDEYALLGSMRHRNALAISKRRDAEERTTAANRKVIDYQTQLAEYQKTKAQTEETIVALERAKGLQSALVDKQLQSDTEKAAMEQKMLEEKIKADAEKHITEAKVLLAKADGMEAEKFAPRPYGMAANLLKGAEKFLKDGKYDVADKQATDASDLFNDAIKEAEPKFNEQQKIVEADKLNKQLFEEADRYFRELTKIDGRGVVIHVDSLFKPNSTKLEKSRLDALDFVATLASKYPNHTVLIEGHTDDRGAESKALTVSQARAEEVKDYFLRRGVKLDRLQTAGKGKNDPAFPNKGKDRNRNNRVDVIFVYR